MANQDIFNLIDSLGKTANTLTERVFVSPVYRNRWIATRIDRIIYRFKIPNTRPGWYRFQPTSQNKARRIGPADMLEIEQYLKMVDRLRLIMLRREGDVLLGIPFKTNKFGFKVNDIYPVRLVSDDMAQEFDEVLCRFDGANIWYETVPLNNDPARSEYLRTSLESRINPSDLSFQGLRYEEKTAYAIKYQLILEEGERERRMAAEERQRQRRLEEERLMRDSRHRVKRAVEHGGGVFRNFFERGDNFSVTYQVDGEEYTSTIAKDRNLTVLTAGVCLSGRDNDFDLTSLISVLREGQDKGLIHRW